MEEAKSPTEPPNDRAQTAAAKLRALRERANQALSSHKQRLGAIETELQERVKQLAEEFDPATTQSSTAERDAELDSLRTQLDESRLKHEQFVAQLVVARQQLEELQSAPCETCETANAKLVECQTEIARLKTELEAATNRHAEDQARHEQFVAQLQTARKAIAELESNSDDRLAELREERDRVAADRDAAIAQLSSLKTEHESHHESAAKAGLEIESLAAEQSRLEQLLAAANDRADEAESQLNESQLKAIAQETELKNMTASLLSLQADHQALLAVQSQSAESCDQWALEKAALIQERDLLESSLQEERAAIEGTNRQLAERLAALESAAQETARKLRDSERAVVESQNQVTAAEATRQTLEADLKAVEAKRQSLASELEATRQDLQAAQDQAAHNAARDKAAAAESIAEVKCELETTQRELAAKAAEAKSSRDQLDALTTNASTANKELALLKTTTVSIAVHEDACRQRDAALESTALEQEQSAQLREALKEAEIELAGLLEIARAQPTVDELHQKFELALADVQKLKRENGSLRDELSRRPEADEEDTPELVALRSERDTLATRVIELENAPAASLDADAQTQLEELQRRFEMAVDDVRQLKRENAELKERSASGVIAAAPSGKLDWAAQKAQLLASLAEEDGAGKIESSRKSERVTVESTIAATDRALAEKQREIDELRSALEAGRPVASVSSATASEEAERLLDADETIAAERAKLAAMQSEWEEKLRTAELEFSVERAKLAREQALLKDRLAELDLANSSGGGDSETKPRRGWKDALGLRDEERKK